MQVRRQYNGNKKVVRESGFDENDQPYADQQGAVSVVYEYDENGKVSATLKYDLSGNLINDNPEEAK